MIARYSSPNLGTTIVVELASINTGSQFRWFVPRSIHSAGGNMHRKRKPHVLRPPGLTEIQILRWADAFHKLTGDWPKARTRPRTVTGAPAENWFALDMALRAGCRGLPGGSSLARLLAARRNRRNLSMLPQFTIKQILGWCDAYHVQAGEWPRLSTLRNQSIPGSHGETWHAVDAALRHGGRGLPGQSSLAQLLAKHRGVRNPADAPRLTVRQILEWADNHHKRTGRWPKEKEWSDEIPGSGGETWRAINSALAAGFRGLSGGSSLAILLAEHRGRRNHMRLPQLTVKRILTWADAFHAKTNEWPSVRCEPQEIPGTSAERWFNVDQALRKGLRGLPGESSLARILAEHRAARTTGRFQRLTVKQILKWVDAFHEAHGTWPTRYCLLQPIPGTNGERWSNVHAALRQGLRGLPGGSSLASFLTRYRGVPLWSSTKKAKCRT
jgi:hypothetical protein